MMKAKELRDKSVEELQAILLDTRKELFSIRNEVKETKKADNPEKTKHMKKFVARLLTVIREKSLAAS
ncbi:MAG: 50S ribosomal protein L29 [Chlamydiota bacterium]|nr:50S ribosomal protein L29 [Chlamydiota bacterium]